MMIVFFCSFVFFCVVVRGDVRGSFLVVVYVVARLRSRHPPFLLSIINKEREEEEGLTKSANFCFLFLGPERETTPEFSAS